MPIRPGWRHLYRGPEYHAQRERMLARAGGRCEQCGVPDRIFARRVDGWWFEKTTRRWRWPNCGAFLLSQPAGRLREPYIVLTMAHLDHDPTNNADENLKMLCQWCHLNYDKLHHAETRATRKDAARPLLAGLA